MQGQGTTVRIAHDVDRVVTDLLFQMRDGEFDDAVGTTLTLTWAQLVDFGINDDGVYQVAATATNADNLTSQAFSNLTILNVAPPPVVTAANTVRLGTPIEIEIRGRGVPARIVETPFVKAGAGSS